MEIPKFDSDFAARLCFACSPDNPIGLKLKPVQEGEMVTAEFTPGEFHQGWDNVVHGGILYTLLDEVTAYAMLCHGIELGVTAKSEIRFKQVASVNEPIKASAWVTKLTRRLVETKGVLTQADGTVIADGSFLFYVWKHTNKAVLWDMDGVISDSYALHFAAWRETFARRGIRFAKADFTRLFGTRNDFIITTVMGQELTEQDTEAIALEKEETFRRKATGNIKPFPGALKLLSTLKERNFRQGLASSAPRENIDLVLGELDLTETFDCIVFGQEVSESKPSPQIYLLAAEKLHSAPGDCMVIEDSPYGVTAAKAAGMKCLAITNTHGPEQLGEADRAIESLQDMDLVTLLTRV
jgi:HAD superfamily hydrolase (TIGR01509 family)